MKLTSNQYVFNKKIKPPIGLAKKTFKAAGAVGKFGANTASGSLNVLQNAAAHDNSTGNQAISSAAMTAGLAVKGTVTAVETACGAVKGTAELAKMPRKITHEIRRSIRFAKLKKHQKIAIPKGVKIKKFKWYDKKLRGLSTAAGTFKIAGFVGKTAAGIAETGIKAGSIAANVFQKTLQKDDSTGNSALNYGVESGRVLSGGVKASGRAIKNSTDLTRKTARTLEKVINPRKRKMLAKSVKRQVRNLKRNVKTTIKTAKKITENTVKGTVKLTVKTAKAAIKFAVNAVRTAAKLAVKAISFIVDTMPWSLIVIAVIILVVVIIFLVSNIISGAVGSVTGAGGWAVDDSTENTPQDIYSNLEVFLDGAEEVLNEDVQDKLKDDYVDPFCNGDTETELKKRRIIEYCSIAQNVVFFSAKGNEVTIDGYIDAFDDAFNTEFYSKFLAVLFVLMTRDKQNAEGISDYEIVDFDFKKQDFKELINTVNNNACQYGETYVFKTATELTGQACPGENCDTYYHSNVNDCPSPNITPADTSQTPPVPESKSCPGHSYCPHLHTKLAVKLYTIEEIKQLDVSEIYNFSDNEKTRYNAAQAFIQGLIDSYGGTP